MTINEKSNNFVINNLNEKNICKKNLVLYKKVNINNNGNTNSSKNEASSGSNNNTNNDNKIKGKTNNLKLKKNSNDIINSEIGNKKLEKKQRNILKLKSNNNKTMNCNLNDFSSTIINQEQMNKRRNTSLCHNRLNFNGISLEKKNSDDHSYAFQNLVNLNNNEKNSKKNINMDKNKSYNIPIKKSFHKKRLEKSPECMKFFLNEKKKYFNDDKCKMRSNIALNRIDIIIEDDIKNNRRQTLDLNSINNIEDNENSRYNNTMEPNHKNKGKDLLEYDGDLETVSYRQENSSILKCENLDDSNKNDRKGSAIINKNHKSRKDIFINELKGLNKTDNEKKIYNEIVEPKNIKSINQNINIETFCSAFFVSGITSPITESSIIEDSFNFLSTCGHKYCSLLLSIKPKVLHYFKNENFEINDNLLENISNFSFPQGAKVCIEGSFESKNIIQSPQQIFYNIIEDNKGEKLYTCTKYYFIRVKNEEFKNIYKFDIFSYMKEKLIKYKNNYFKKYLQNINQLLNGETFFVPQSITLLSKEPFLNSMEICLNGFISSLLEERVIILNHIINEIPSPHNGDKIKFYISPYFAPIILNHEMNIYKVMAIANKEKLKLIYFNNYLSKEQLNFKILFEMISIDHIIFIFQLILLEQKILFVYNDYKKLSIIIFIFISLIYPFSWKENQIFPVISLDNINLLQTPKPFISGIDEYLFSYIDKSNNNIFKLRNDIIIYNLYQKSFIFCKTKKKISRKDLMHEYKISPLPEKITNFLIKELKSIYKQMSIKENNLFEQKNNINYDYNFYKNLILLKQDNEFLTKLIFTQSLIMLIGDYNNYTFFIEEEKPLFNKEAFIESHKEKEFKSFLNQFLKTKLFNNFLENEKKIWFMKKNNENEENEIHNNDNNDIDYDTSFFIKISLKFPELINNYQIRNNVNSISNIMNINIYKKAKMLCSKLVLINSSIKSNINNNMNEKDKENNLKIPQSENSQINKRKTNVLFSGKDYLEDKSEDNINKEYLNINRSKNYDTFSSDIINFKKNKNKLKDSKLSSEATTLSTYFNLINKNDIKEDINEKSKIVYIDINSKRKISTNEKNNNKNQIINNFLLVPYFLNLNGDDEDYVKEKNTEEIILEEMISYKKRKNIKEKIPPLNILITTLSKYIDYTTYNIKRTKIYLIKDNYNNLNDKKDNTNKKTNKVYIDDNSNFNNEVKSFKNKYFKEEVSEKDIIDLNNIYGKDEENILINRCFKSCFINKPEISNQHLILLKKLFLNIENREYFANLIIPDLLLKNRSCQKQLTISSFNKFSKIIKLSFENLNLNDNNLGRLLTLACFIYYKMEKDSKIVYIYQDFIINNTDNSQKNSQPYELWNADSFWIEFFNSEFESNNNEKIEEEFEAFEEEKNEENKNNTNNLSYINKNENEDLDKRKKICLIKTVIGVSNIMFKLNLEKNFIINIIEKMILPVFVNDFYYINHIMKLALIANNVN